MKNRIFREMYEQSRPSKETVDTLKNRLAEEKGNGYKWIYFVSAAACIALIAGIAAVMIPAYRYDDIVAGDNITDNISDTVTVGSYIEEKSPLTAVIGGENEPPPAAAAAWEFTATLPEGYVTLLDTAMEKQYKSDNGKITVYYVTNPDDGISYTLSEHAENARSAIEYSCSEKNEDVVFDDPVRTTVSGLQAMSFGYEAGGHSHMMYCVPCDNNAYYIDCEALTDRSAAAEEFQYFIDHTYITAVFDGSRETLGILFDDFIEIFDIRYNDNNTFSDFYEKSIPSFKLGSQVYVQLSDDDGVYMDSYDFAPMLSSAMSCEEGEPFILSDESITVYYDNDIGNSAVSVTFVIDSEKGIKAFENYSISTFHYYPFDSSVIYNNIRAEALRIKEEEHQAMTEEALRVREEEEFRQKVQEEINRMQEEQQLKEREEAEIQRREAEEAMSIPAEYPEISLIRPVPDIPNITETYGLYDGEFHKGVDFSAPGCEGMEIVAAADGKIISARNSGNGYGICIIIDHGNWEHGTYNTLYAHCSEALVKEGDEVKAGDVIGKIGSTGYAYGPHLHFELRLLGELAGGQHTDPEPYFE